MHYATIALYHCTAASDGIRDYILDHYPTVLPLVVLQIAQQQASLETPLRIMTFAAGTSRHTEAVIASWVLRYVAAMIADPYDHRHRG